MTRAPLAIGAAAGVALLAMVVAPVTAEAQQAPKVYRIGFLRPGEPPKTFVEAFRQGLRERGYVEGQNVAIEYRFARDGFDELVRLAGELVRLNVDVILASAGPAVRAAQKATTTVPVVFVGVYDPVESGLVPSLARPGGNVTGLSLSSADLGGKRLELLRELVPKLPRVAVLWHPANPTNPVQLRGVESAARAVGVDGQALPVRGPDDFEPAFNAARAAGGLLTADAPLFTAHRTRLAALSARNRVPAIYPFREFAEAGGLMSYGADLPHLYTRAATHVERILKGARPAELPIEQPTRFELVINVKVARALGLTVPPSLLLRADRLLE